MLLILPGEDVTDIVKCLNINFTVSPIRPPKIYSAHREVGLQ